MRLLANTSLKAKLMIQTGLLLVGAGAMGVLAVDRLETLDEAAKNVAEIQLPGAIHAGRVESEIRLAGREIRSLLLADAGDRARHAERFEHALTRVAQELANVREHLTTDDGRRGLDETAEVAAEWRGELMGVARLALAGAVEEARAKLSSPRNVELFDRLNERVEALIARKAHDAEVTKRRGDDALSAGRRIVLAALFLMIAAGAFVAWQITRSISHALGMIGERAEQLRANCITGLRTGLDAMAHGDLSAKVEATTPLLDVTTEDELGELAETINGVITQTQASVAAFKTSVGTLSKVVDETTLLTRAGREGHLSARGDAGALEGSYRDLIGGLNATIEAFLSPVREATETLEKVAARDFTVKMSGDFAGDHARIEEALNTAIDEVKKALESIGDAARELSHQSEELSASSSQISQGSEEASRQAGVVSAAAEEISKNVASVATGTEQMTASIREIAKSASEAATVAAKAVAVAESTGTVVAKLGTSTAEIGDVIKVITSIAQQTNLLALNATIEAARAGEAGKGFAVVATEVKELAKQTARATEDIGRRIEAIQGDSREAVKAIREIGSIVAQIDTLQGSIAAAVEEQTATANEMSRSVSEAAVGSSEIARNITEVARTAEETAAGATQGRSAAERLAEMASALEMLLGQFQFERADQEHAAPGAKARTTLLLGRSNVAEA